jgi:3-deoxy-D-arabino-heptulosonate 7-phosphate (DAHP) synthase class II
MKAIIERIWGDPRNGSWSSQSKIGNVEDGIVREDGVEIDPEGTKWRKITRDEGQFRLGPVSHVGRQTAVRRFGQKVIDDHFPPTMTEIPWVKEQVVYGPDPTVFPNDIIGSTFFKKAAR